MIYAEVIAARTMREYFEARGEKWPADEAAEFLEKRRACASAQRGGWVVDALAILDRARFDVDDLAENHLGLHLTIESLAHLDSAAGAEVFGLARPRARTITVDPRAEQYEPLYRSTVMHEVAHVLLHGAQAQDSRYSPESKMRPPFEREADRFMVATLLPGAILDLAMLTISSIRGLRLGNAIVGANTRHGRYQWRSYYFPFMVDQLAVSREMIGIAMQERGIFSADTAEYHRSHMLETRWKKPSTRGPLAREIQRIMDGLVSTPALAQPG